jgi:hypothetical protein
MRLSPAVLLALSCAMGVGCGDADTYYPIITCRKGCTERTVWPDRAYPRRRLTVPPVQYTALVERQDVIREVQDLGPESLTRLGWLCTVRTRRDWECVGDGNERIAMVHGQPRDTTINDDDYRLVFVPYCLWKQVEWHNATMLAADDLPWDPATERDDAAGLMGCDPALRFPWDALLTGRAPTSADVWAPRTAAATRMDSGSAVEPADANTAPGVRDTQPDWDAVRRALGLPIGAGQHAAGLAAPTGAAVPSSPAASLDELLKKYRH